MGETRVLVSEDIISCRASFAAPTISGQVIELLPDGDEEVALQVKTRDETFSVWLGASALRQLADSLVNACGATSVSPVVLSFEAEDSAADRKVQFEVQSNPCVTFEGNEEMNVQIIITRSDSDFGVEQCMVILGIQESRQLAEAALAVSENI